MLHYREIGWSLVGAAVLAVVSLRAAPGAAGQDPADNAARTRFLDIERVARFPAEEQAKEIPRLYRELAPPVLYFNAEGLLSYCPADILHRDAGISSAGGSPTDRWAKQLADAVARLTADQVADNLGSRLWLDIAGRARAIQTLRRHLPTLRPLVREDLESAKPERVGRAAAFVHTLRLEEFLDTILTIYLRNDACSPAAQGALIWYPNPDARVAKALLADVAKTPAAVIRHGELLNGMLWRRPADPVLVRLLVSPEVAIRRAAAWALSDCKDDSLAPHVAKLAKDTDRETRIACARMAERLSDRVFTTVSGEVQSLLRDPETKVRIQACSCLAAHKDLAAAHTLLAFLKSAAVEPGDAVGIMQALAKLTGSTFNYNLHQWGPASPGNREAIARFEEWIRRQMPRT
jgi:hypothetical protein